MGRYLRISDYENRPESFQKFLFFSGQVYLIGGSGTWTKSLDRDAGADYETVSLDEMPTSHLKNALRYIQKDKRNVDREYSDIILNMMEQKIIELKQEIKKRS